MPSFEVPILEGVPDGRHEDIPTERELVPVGAIARQGPARGRASLSPPPRPIGTPEAAAAPLPSEVNEAVQRMRKGGRARLVVGFALFAVAIAALGAVFVKGGGRTRASAPVGDVTVRTEPPGATLRVDGRKQDGITPLTVTGLTRGVEHLLIAELRGHDPASRAVRIPQDGPGVVEATLKLSPAGTARGVGGLKVLSSPDGAEILLDGEARGVTPLAIDDVPAGRPIELVARREGWTEARRTIAPLRPGERRTEDFMLAPARERARPGASAASAASAAKPRAEPRKKGDIHRAPDLPRLGTSAPTEALLPGRTTGERVPKTPPP